MSGDDRPGVRATAMQTGAHGFVLKHESPEVFHRAVTELLELAGLADFFTAAAAEGVAA